MIYLDTHVVAWLYAGRLDLLSERARGLLERHDPVISPIVTLELQYLHETGRTNTPGLTVIETLRQQIGLRLCDRPFAVVASAAVEENWTRDPFDRFVVAQARLAGAPLLSRDRNVRAHYSGAAWDDSSDASP